MLFTPMPNANVRLAINEKLGFFRNIRTPNRKSCPNRSSEAGAPHLARDFLDQPHIAEFSQGIRMSLFCGFAVLHPLADSQIKMAADFGVKFGFALLSFPQG
jgi:hypothetical protein